MEKKEIKKTNEKKSQMTNKTKIEEKKKKENSKLTETTKNVATKSSNNTKPKGTNNQKNDKSKTESSKVINDKILSEEKNNSLQTIPNQEKVTNSSKKTIKRSDIFLIVGLILVVVLGCLLMKGEKVEPSYELPLTLTGEAGLQELTYAEYQQKIDNNESFVVILERASCSHCQNFLPVAEEFAEDNSLPMYYVDTDTFSSDDWTNFSNSNTFLKKKSSTWGTPTTVVLAGSEAVDYIEGETTSDKLLDLYNEYFNVEK